MSKKSTNTIRIITVVLMIVFMANIINFPVAMAQTNQIVYNFDDESQEDLEYEIAFVQSGQTLSYENSPVSSYGQSLKVTIPQSGYKDLFFKRQFTSKAQAGDTIKVDVYIPADQQIKSLQLRAWTKGAAWDQNQSSQKIQPESGTYLEQNKWYTLEMTVNQKTIWPSASFTLSVECDIQSYIYVDNCTVSGNGVGNRQPYEGVKSDTFNDIDPIIMAEEMIPGWNYGNTMETYNEGIWNPIANPEMFKFIKEQGFNSVRIPIQWDKHIISGNPDFTIDEEWLDRCEYIVDEALAQGLYVIINTHHEDWMKKGLNGSLFEQNLTRKKFKAIWQQIAERFKYKDEHLLFEFMNEVEADAGLLNEVNNEILSAIRETGGFNDKRMLVLAGSGHNIINTLDLEIPADDNIMVTYHEYNFGKNEWGTDYQKSIIDNNMLAIKEKFIDNGIPAIIGEYGSYSSMSDVNNTWYQYVISRAEMMGGFVPMIWDNGDKSNGLYNFTTKECYYNDVYDIIMSCSKGECDKLYTGSTLYDEIGYEIKTLYDFESDSQLNDFKELSNVQLSLVEIDDNDKALSFKCDTTSKTTYYLSSEGINEQIKQNAGNYLKAKIFIPDGLQFNNITFYVTNNKGISAIESSISYSDDFNGGWYTLITDRIPDGENFTSVGIMMTGMIGKGEIYIDDISAQSSQNIWNFEKIKTIPFEVTYLYPQSTKVELGINSTDENKFLDLSWSDAQSSTNYKIKANLKQSNLDLIPNRVLTAKVFVPDNIQIPNVKITYNGSGYSNMNLTYGWNEIKTEIIPDDVQIDEIGFELSDILGSGNIYIDDIEIDHLGYIENPSFDYGVDIYQRKLPIIYNKISSGEIEFVCTYENTYAKENSLFINAALFKGNQMIDAVNLFDTDGKTKKSSKIKLNSLNIDEDDNYYVKLFVWDKSMRIYEMPILLNK